MGLVVRVQLDQLNGTLTRFNFEHPKAADVGTAMLLPQPSRHANLLAMLCQKGQVCGLVSRSHRHHLWAFFEYGDKTHGFL
jgi:hypothetical protein